MSCSLGGSTIAARIHPHAQAEYLLPHRHETVFWARWLTTAFLARADPPSADSGDAALIVTELVANVIRHTESRCRLSLCAGPGYSRSPCTPGAAGVWSSCTPSPSTWRSSMIRGKTVRAALAAP